MSYKIPSHIIQWLKLNAILSPKNDSHFRELIVSEDNSHLYKDLLQWREAVTINSGTTGFRTDDIFPFKECWICELTKSKVTIKFKEIDGTTDEWLHIN